MSQKSPMMLIGIGGSGGAIARGVCRAFGSELRHVTIDTDARSGEADENFILIGGDRLSGRGSGGDLVAARIASEESIRTLDGVIDGVRLAVIVTSLGGGTGGGATLETARYLTACGIPSVVFATLPFAMEGEDRQRNARGIMSMIEENASATFFTELDELVAGTDNMQAAMKLAIDTMAVGITLFWRLVEKPGYLQLDVERIRHLLSRAGRGRFAAVGAQGADRASRAVEELVNSPILKAGSNPVRAILCGVLAGEDLRLSEVGRIASGIRTAYGEKCSFELATVNDEATFSGRLSIVAMLFESNAAEEDGADKPAVKGMLRHRNVPLAQGPTGRGRFTNSEPTIWHGEDLDLPTFVRQNINLDF